MTLEVYSRYFNHNVNKTIVAIQDSDQSVFVRFDAQLDGNQIDLSETELLDRAVSWFTNRYIQEYAGQKLDEKVREIEERVAKGETNRNQRFAVIEDKFALLNGSVMEMLKDYYSSKEEGDGDVTMEEGVAPTHVDGSDNSTTSEITETE